MHSVVALAVAAFCTSAYAGAWDYSTDTDPMTGSKVQWAYLYSDNSLDLRFPYSGKNLGALIVRSRKSDGLNAAIQIEKGQIICDGYSGCSVKVRFNEEQPQSFHATAPADHSHNTLFLSPASRFVEKARTAKTIRVELTIYEAGAPVLTFTAAAPLKWETTVTPAKPATRSAQTPAQSSKPVTREGIINACTEKLEKQVQIGTRRW